MAKRQSSTLAEPQAKRQRGLDNATPPPPDSKSQGVLDDPAPQQRILLYLGAVLECDVPILEALHHRMPWCLRERVRLLHDRLRIDGWQLQRHGCWCASSEHWEWIRAGTRVWVDAVQSAHQHELVVLAVNATPTQRLRLCYSAAHGLWFVGDRRGGSLCDVSPAAVWEWLVAALPRGSG